LKKHISTIIMIALAIAVFAFIGYSMDLKATWESIKKANFYMIGLGSITMLIAHFLRGYRWNMLTETANINLNYRRSFYSVMIGYLVNTATSRGGEVVRCALTAKSEKAPVETVIGTVITERIADLVFMLVLGILCVCIQFDQFYGFINQNILTPLAQNPLIILVIIIAIIGSWFIIKRLTKNKKGNKDSLLGRLLIGMKSILKLKNPFLFAILSLAIWLGYWIGMYFQLQALDITVHFNLANALGILMFSAMGIIIPIPGGAGVYGTIALGLTLMYNLPTKEAQTFSIFNIAFSNIFHITMGAICYGLLFFEIRKMEAKNENIK